MKLVITGCNGQLGNELKRILTDKKAEIGPISPAYDQAEFWGADVDQVDFADQQQAKAYLDGIRPDVIINCAAFTNVDQCEKDPEAAERGNVLLAKNLAQLAEQIQAKLVHVSTDYVFKGYDRSKPYTEQDPCEPETVYGKTKLAGEKEVEKYCSRAFIVRTAWLYGYQGNNFVKTISGLARKNKAVKVVMDQVGNPTNANDLAYHILKLCLTEQYGVYHCTGTGICSWYEFAREIIEAAGIDAAVSPCTTAEFPRPAKRPAYSAPDNAKLDRAVGNQMRHWKTALQAYLNHGGLEGRKEDDNR